MARVADQKHTSLENRGVGNRLLDMSVARTVRQLTRVVFGPYRQDDSNRPAGERRNGCFREREVILTLRAYRDQHPGVARLIEIGWRGDRRFPYPQRPDIVMTRGQALEGMVEDPVGCMQDQVR